MKTITTFAQITEDGILRLEVPCGLSSGLAEVAIIVHLLTDAEVGTESSVGQSLPDFSLSHAQQQETNFMLERGEEGPIIGSISQQTSLADLLDGYIGVIDSSEYV